MYKKIQGNWTYFVFTLVFGRICCFLPKIGQNGRSPCSRNVFANEKLIPTCFLCLIMYIYSNLQLHLETYIVAEPACVTQAYSAATGHSSVTIGHLSEPPATTRHLQERPVYLLVAEVRSLAFKSQYLLQL